MVGYETMASFAPLDFKIHIQIYCDIFLLDK